MSLEHLRRLSFEWEGANRDGSPLHVSGVVRERAAVDKFRRVAFKAQLPTENAASFVSDFERGQFADFVMLTESITGLPWWVGVYASPELCQTAFEQWQVLPPDLMDRWYDALVSVNTEPEESTNGAAVPEGVDEDESETDPNG